MNWKLIALTVARKRFNSVVRAALLCFALLLLPLAMIHAASDPFLPWLDSKAPVILREEPAAEAPGVVIRKVMLQMRDDSEIFAVIATPKAPGKYPGILVLHGGGGCAETDKAIAWAQRGYIAVAPDLPGIADPKKLTQPKGRWCAMKYGEGRYVATPDATASILFDAVLAAMKSLYLLRSQPDVDTSRIGVVGVSWGGYLTTMVCGLAGEHVRAGFSVFGCGFYELTSQQPALLKMPEDERARWLEQLDAGRRAPGIKADFFIAGAANDFFFWPPGVQATLDAIPAGKNHLFSPNESHKVSLPGGTVFQNQKEEPFTPTPFQPIPTPKGSKANWLAMEVPWFDYFLKGNGKPFPVVKIEPGGDPLSARFSMTSPEPISKAEVYWSKPNPDWTKRQWLALPTVKTEEGVYVATLPAEAADGADWFAAVSDIRGISVGSNLAHIKAPTK